MKIYYILMSRADFLATFHHLDQLKFKKPNLRPTPYLRSIINKGIKEYKNGKGNLRKFKSVEDLIRDLES
jgi:hypothetical protein